MSMSVKSQQAAHLKEYFIVSKLYLNKVDLKVKWLNYQKCFWKMSHIPSPPFFFRWAGLWQWYSSGGGALSGPSILGILRTASEKSNIFQTMGDRRPFKNHLQIFIKLHLFSPLP